MGNVSIYKDTDYVNKFDDIKYGSRFGKYLRDYEIANFISFIDPDCETILDVGSGTGKISMSSRFKKYRIVSLDSSYTVLGYSKIKALNSSIRYMPVVADTTYMCFKDRSFDCVIASRLLMHCADWKKALSEICRVSKKIIVLDFPITFSPGGLDSLFKKTKKIIFNDTISYSTYSISNIMNELEFHNFKTVECKRGFLLPLLFHRFLDNPGISVILEKFLRSAGLTDITGSPAILKAVRRNLS